MGGLKNLGKAIGKGWEDVKKAPVQVVRAGVDAAAAPAKAAIEVVKGKPIDKALKDAIAERLGAPIAVAEAAGVIQTVTKDLGVQLVANIGGQKAGDVLADFDRVIQPFPPEDQAATLRGIQDFIKTGDLNSLNPISILTAGEISDARNNLVSHSKPIEEAVINVMPDAVRAVARNCMYLAISDVPGDLNLPKFAIDHLNQAQAITLIDVIVFKSIPDIGTLDGRYVWAHELWHAHQYQLWGVQAFSQKYIVEQIGFHSSGWKVNAVEVEAIAFGCRNFFVNDPGYGVSCAYALGLA